MDIKNVLVIGAGQMGKQIALVSAIHGYQTTLNDTFPEALTAAAAWKNEYLDGRIAKGKMTPEQVAEIKTRFQIEIDLAQVAKDADLVIEAIIEKEDTKQELFAQLDKLAKSTAILASNSSYIPSSKVARSTNRPSQVANLHFFNPALVMKLVEVVQGEHTSEETAQTLMEFARSCGKSPILVRKEIDGFVTNRILADIMDEAMFLVDGGYVTPTEVDIAVEKGLNHPMGPFKLMDLVGLDISYLSRQRRFAQTGEEKDRPSKSLEEKYKEGKLGRKTGEGWYKYPSK